MTQTSEILSPTMVTVKKELRRMSSVPVLVEAERKQSWFGRTWDVTIRWADVTLKDVWRREAHRRLESKLSKMVRTASGHKKDKIPQGDSRYKTLWLIADGEVAAFCKQHDVSRAIIDSQVPALTELKQLATDPIVVPNHMAKLAAKWAGKGILGGSIFFILLGITCTLIHNLFYLGVSIIHGISNVLTLLIHAL